MTFEDLEMLEEEESKVPKDVVAPDVEMLELPLVANLIME